MNLLLDTCALIWALGQPQRLSVAARKAIEDSTNRLWLSAISGFEVGLLHRLGQIELKDEPMRWFDLATGALDLTVVPISWQAALQSTLLPPIHRDPADRIIVVTALDMGASVLTPDPQIGRYPGVRTFW